MLPFDLETCLFTLFLIFAFGRNHSQKLLPASFPGRVVFVDPGIGQDLVKDIQQGLLQELVNVLFINVWVLFLQFCGPWQVDFSDLVVLAKQVFLDLAQLAL